MLVKHSFHRKGHVTCSSEWTKTDGYNGTIEPQHRKLLHVPNCVFSHLSRSHEY